MAHGGKRENAGRKTKANEIKLIEQMDRYITPDAFWANVAKLVENNDMHAIRLWANYRFGMPNQKIEQTGKAFENIRINLIEQ